GPACDRDRHDASCGPCGAHFFRGDLALRHRSHLAQSRPCRVSCGVRAEARSASRRGAWSRAHARPRACSRPCSWALFYGHDAHEACDHHVPVELVQSRSFRWRDAVPVVLAAGSRPCSGAIIILVFALSQGILGSGIAAVIAMALGVAITVSTLAILSVFAKQAAQRFAGGEGRYALAGAALELLAAAFVALLGLGLLMTQLGSSLGFDLLRHLPMISAG
ncbi:MAG: hypothetical protein JOY67_21610, partial [Hyphomicrobiales bacterium]|nr:hypothetical protein [Hyphomicrobiales bacterium]